MSSHVVISTKKFCTRSMENLCAAIEILGYDYQKIENAIFIEGCRIETAESFAYMNIAAGDNKALSLFQKINGKLSEIESQIRAQNIEKNRIEQVKAKQDAEMYRVRQLKREEERLDYERYKLELERRDFVDAKKKAIITKAKEMGYSVEERSENGVVKLKLIKRIY